MAVGLAGRLLPRYGVGSDRPMLFAVPCKGHEPHEFVAGECHRCGRLLEVALGSAVETLQDPGMVRLRGAITKTRAEWEVEADRLGITYGEYVEQHVRPRLAENPDVARRRRCFQDRKFSSRAYRRRACTAAVRRPGFRVGSPL